MKRASFGFFLAAFALFACGSSSSSTTPNGVPSGGDGNGATTTTCFDASGNATATCAVEPTGDVCALGDATICTPLTKVEVYADDGTNGVCLHLVFENDCTSEIYADTCIEHDENGTIENECWTSSKPVGTAIDLSQCHATGKYFSVTTTGAGDLTIDEAKCPAPK